jgi:deoxycytidine triphosphate deaminase
MRLIDSTLFSHLVGTGDIHHRSCVFLDGVKIGLRIDGAVFEQSSDIYGREPAEPPPVKIDLMNGSLLAGKFYLASTVEQLAISNRIMGFMHTRSRWARLGLDCLGSSTYVAPGFGNTSPLPLVLEIRPARNFHRVDFAEPVAALLLFLLEDTLPIKLA